MEKRNAHRSGIALVLVSALLSLLAFLGVAFVRATGLSARAAESGSARAGADLALESGLAYAQGRSGREIGYPPTLALAGNRGDDWTFRSGIISRLDGAANISFSHGESWVDADGNGAFDPGEAYLDADGDGRFSARTGRLRRGSRGDPETFSLKLVSPGGLYRVNAFGVSPRLGDNLGAILFAPGEVPERVDRAYGEGEPIEISALGRHLVSGEDQNRNGFLDREDRNGNGVLDPGEDVNNSGFLDPGEDVNGNGRLDPGEDVNRNGILDSEDANGNGQFDVPRPSGGYRSLDEVRAVLAAAGYGSAQIEKVIPFIYLGAHDWWDETAETVELATAPREILEALWRYAAFKPFRELKDLNRDWNSNEWLDLPYGRSGDAIPYSSSSYGASVMIYPDEASRLADWAIAFRAAWQRSSWLAFRRSLLVAATPPGGPGSLFETDTAPLMAWPEAAWGWARAKADAAFFAVSPEGNPFGVSANERHWGIDHGPLPNPLGTITRPFVGVGDRSGFPFPTPAGSAAWSGSPYADRLGYDYGSVTQRLTLAPPTQMKVEALGRSGRARAAATAILRVAEKLEFTVQEDFENTVNGGIAQKWIPRGIRVIDPGNRNERRRVVPDVVENLSMVGGPPTLDVSQRGAVTGPTFNPNGCSSMDASQTSGFVALAGKHTTHQGGLLYWPFQADDIRIPLTGRSDLENEWKTQSRNPPPYVPPSLAYNDLHSNIAPISPWQTQVRNTSDAVCSPFRFPPLTNGGSMEDFSIEFWTGGTGSVFLMEGEAAIDPLNPIPADQRKIALSVERNPGVDASGNPGTRFKVGFVAPCNGTIRVEDDEPGLPRPPPESAYNFGHFQFQCEAFYRQIDPGDPNLPGDERVSLGIDHIVITLENVLEMERDLNGDGWAPGVVVPGVGQRVGDDWNGSGVQDLCRNLTFTVYINGIEAGKTNDIDQTIENIRPRYLFGGRGNGSAPYAMSENEAGERLRYFSVTGDELKFYDTVTRANPPAGLGVTDAVLKLGDVRQRYELGRFVLPAGPKGDACNPEFVSPMYDFGPGANARILCAGWTGVPAGDPFGTERVGMTVKVGAPRLVGAVRTVDGPELEPTEMLTGPDPFAGYGPFDSLAWSIEFSNLQPAFEMPLYATPLCESVWMLVQRRGRSPAWIERN